MPPRTTTLVAAAGEYYVLSRLCLIGYIAAPAPKGVPNIDIIATDQSGNRRFDVQVKSRLGKGKDKGWHMSKKHEQIVSDSLFYCFVDFGNGLAALPTTFVVPSRIVAEAVKTSHRVWLARPGKKGPHKDTDFRRFMPDYSVDLGEQCGEYGLEPYREAWQSFHAT